MDLYLMEVETSIESKKKHNGIISFWKFMFSIMIVIFHLTIKLENEGTLMLHGRIGVEFFFLVSGFLMAKKALNRKEENLSIAEDTVQYILGKIKSFFGYLLVAFVFAFLVNNYYNDYTKSQMINSVWNLLMVDMSGVKTTFVVDQSWYLSAMLISMLIIYPLIRKYKKNFTYIMAPVIVFFLGGWIAHKVGNLRGPTEWVGFTYKGVIRAFFELSLGTILYEIVEKIKKIKFTKVGIWLISIIENIGFISIFIIVNLKDASNKYDFFMLFILAISIVLAFSEKTVFYNIFKKNFIFYLEKLSLPIYLNHQWINLIVTNVFKNAVYELKIILAVMYSIGFSIVCVYIIEKLKKINKEKLKAIFIQD